MIAAFLSPLEGTTVLDVGTGTGRAAIALAQRGAPVTGVDASAEMLAVATRRAADAERRRHIRCAVMRTASTFADRSFDAVVCLRVLMHTPDWRQSLAELCRVAPAIASSSTIRRCERRGAAGGRPAHRSRRRARESRPIACFGDRQHPRALAREWLPDR